jgi:hypothetical protein
METRNNFFPGNNERPLSSAQLSGPSFTNELDGLRPALSWFADLGPA